MGVSYLLDTHVLLWLLAAPDRVPAAVRDMLADRSNGLVVSAISALEVATKTRLGTLAAPGLVESWAVRVASLEAESLPVAAEHAFLAGSMNWAHRDPFDRVLVAQATVEAMTLVTVDAALSRLPTPTILTW